MWLTPSIGNIFAELANDDIIISSDRNKHNFLHQFARYFDIHLNKMFQHGLLQDPFFETVTGLEILVTGLLPVSFTKRTEKGDHTYIKLTTLFWEIEHEKAPDSSKFELHFRVNKLIRYLKQKLVIEWRERQAEEDTKAAEQSKRSSISTNQL